MPRAVFLKQSGERLQDKDESKEVFTPHRVRSVGEKLAKAHYLSKELDIVGLTVVSGAGNIIRGDKLREGGVANEFADFMGRLATIQNTLVIAEQLKRQAVPYLVLITEKMLITDKSFESVAYSVDNVMEAHADGRVVLIGGGTGVDNVTTDHAVVAYASDYSKASEHEALILKGTQVDGVFEGDPDKVVDAQRNRVIGAPHMLRNYDRYGVVDRASLEALVENQMAMLVYSDGGHDLETILRHDHLAEGSNVGYGTLIVSDDIPPQPWAA